MSQHSRQRQFQTPSPSGTPAAALPEKSIAVGTEKSKTQFYSIVQPAPVPGESPTTLHTPPGPYEVQQPSMMTNNAAVVAALEGKCEFPKNKMLMNLAEDINERGHRLEKQPYYVGMLNADDVAKYLRKVGDFGIHASDQEGGQVKLMLTVRGHNDVYHFDLVFDGKGRGWNFHPRPPDSPFLKTVIELVDFYKTTPLPTIPEKLCLRDSITRPAWFLKHENVTYDKKDLLGKGNFCEVFLGKLENRRCVAVKVCRANWRYTIDTADTHDLNTKEKDARDALIKEGSLMSRVRHPNIIRFYGICCDHPPIMIALEFCPGNSLIKHLINMKEAIEMGERIKFLSEAAAGMACLEEKELVHRDLAARNCLISKYGRVKIADFGLSKLVSQLANENWQKQQVPIRWMSPETLKRNPEYSSKSDVWAFGILTWEVFSYGEKPWPDWENKKIATFIRRGQMMPMPEYTPTQMKSLVSKMWALKPSERPDFAEILKQINKIQLSYPPPKPEKCSVIRIKGVIVPPPNFNIDEEEHDDDIQIAAAAFSITPSRELPQPSVQGNNPVGHNEEHEKIPEKKKKKIYRTGCCLLDFILNKGRHKSNEEVPHRADTPAPSSPVEKKKRSNKQAVSSDVKSVDGNVEFEKKSDMTPSTEQKTGTSALKKK